MRPTALAIFPLVDPALLAGLAADAEADGRRMVSRLIAEWLDGRNRFNRPGERAYFAVDGGQVVAVCGLNVDPFADDPAVGRVRRMYVAVEHRRKGAGSAMLKELADEAKSHFRVLHLRTDDAGASAFYEANGFSRVEGDPNCTHRRPVIALGPHCCVGRAGDGAVPEGDRIQIPTKANDA